MNKNDQNTSFVENVLQDVQFVPNPDFQSALHQRLQQQLLEAKKGHRFPPVVSINGRQKTNWRVRLGWGLSSAAALCLAFVLMVVMVPAVQAQVIALFQQFGVRLPFTDQGVVISPFVPLAPEKVPAEMKHFASLNQQVDGPVYIEMRYFSQDKFIVIDESEAQAGFVLPQGEPVHIGSYDGVVEQNLGGMVFLAAQAPQPWRQTGNGGGGGISDEPSDTPPQQLVYSGATRFTWVQSGLQIELLTNLPYDEALRQAASLKAAPQLKK